MQYNLKQIKELGKIKNKDNFERLLSLYTMIDDIDMKREIVSSIGRHYFNNEIYEFIKNNGYKCYYMDVVYQMYRTCLYKGKYDYKFIKLGDEIKKYFDNEVINKMYEYYIYKHNSKKKFVPQSLKLDRLILLKGNNLSTLPRLPNNSVQLIFTSPPYYNARIYSNYKSYKDYLNEMYKTMLECYRILEDGRFIIINVSPVISRRPGREFESIRYPIHFDFHTILSNAGFYFIDEIIWIKPETSVKNRNAGYQQTKKPLSYKPNCISESLLVYRKNSPFLLDYNIQKYNSSIEFDDADNKEYDSSNCWYISPTYNKTHPAVFPKELCRRVLKYYSYKSDVVLDPFAGSGTFGSVALDMGRIPILCEQNYNYCKMINKNGEYNDF